MADTTGTVRTDLIGGMPMSPPSREMSLRSVLCLPFYQLRAPAGCLIFSPSSRFSKESASIFASIAANLRFECRMEQSESLADWAN
jgi:hypothetical protein